MAETTAKMIKGETMNLGGDDYVVPPLNLDNLEEHAGIIDQLSDPELALPEQRKIQTTLITAALKRNYPDMTEDKVRQIVDMGNLIDVTQAIMGKSGFMLKGGQKPGETKPEE